MEATLSKVGNSMAVILPKHLRQEACIEAGDPLKIESPRKGVVVITSAISTEDRSSRLRAAQDRIAARAEKVLPWPSGTSAQDMLAQGKETSSHELFLP